MAIGAVAKKAKRRAGILKSLTAISNRGGPADDVAFNNMQEATRSKASKLFTESQYNTLASKEERAGYDKKAYSALLGMWQSDRDKNQFKGIDFDRYIELLKPSLFEERVLAR